MFGSIASVAIRLTGDSHLKFKVDENQLSSESARAVSKIETLDGNVVVTDWGFAEGRKAINLAIVISIEDYETLIDFHEDNTNTFLFHYKRDSYIVIIRNVRKNGFYGANIKAAIQMDVVEKLNGDGEYTG